MFKFRTNGRWDWVKCLLCSSSLIHRIVQRRKHQTAFSNFLFGYAWMLCNFFNALFISIMCSWKVGQNPPRSRRKTLRLLMFFSRLPAWVIIKYRIGDGITCRITVIHFSSTDRMGHVFLLPHTMQRLVYSFEYRRGKFLCGTACFPWIYLARTRCPPGNSTN